MLSLIVSSASDEMYAAFEHSVNTTIGCAYEIIRIKNSTAEIGICEAYNIGAAKAKYVYLCFIHEDVAFVTAQWGNKIICHLQPNDVGIVGLGGSIYKGRMVSPWWERFHTEQNLERLNITQHYKYNSQDFVRQVINPHNETIAEVVSLDGVLLCMKKKTWQEHRFDEKMLKGFHGYDLDISLSVRRHLKNYVIFDIELQHFSEGRTDMAWFYSLLKVHLKHKKMLPFMHLTGDERLKPLRNDWKTVSFYADKMIQERLPFTTFFKNIYYLISLIDVKTFTVSTFLKGFMLSMYSIVRDFLNRRK